MKKFWIRIAIWILDKLDDKVSLDLDQDAKNDLTELKDKLQLKLEELKKK